MGITRTTRLFASLVFALILAVEASAQQSRTRRAPDRPLPSRVAERRAERDAARDAEKRAAVAAAAKFKPGDLVEAVWIRDWLPAKVVSVEGDRVRVRYDVDGFEKDVPPAEIRPRGAVGRNPARAAAPDPSVPAVKGDAAGAPLAVADWSAAERITLDPDVAWSFKPPAKAPPVVQPKPVVLPPAFPVEKGSAQNGRSVWEKFTGASRPDALAPYFYVNFTNNDPRGSKCVRVQKADVAAGKLAAVWEFPAETNLIDASPDGRLVLVRQETWNDIHRRLDLYDVGGPKPKHVVSFEPFAGEEKANLAHARLLDNAHLLVSNGERVGVFQIDGLRALWSIAMEKDGQSFLSPDRATLAITGPQGIHLLDAKTGKSLARIPTGSQVYGLSFKPDQTRLCGQSADRRLQVWDLTSGKLLHGLPLQFGVDAGYAHWVDNDQLLIGNLDLFDLAKGVVVWQYTRDAFGGPLLHIGNQYAMVDEGPPPGGGVAARAATGNRKIAFFTLPHPAARKHAASLRVNDLLLIRPGAKVSLDIQFDGPPEAREKAEARARAELTQHGVTVADGQPVRLLISSKAGETKQIGYGRTMFGPGGRREPEETLSVTEQIHRVALLVGEKTVVWEANGRFTGQGIFRKEESKSMGEVIEEAKQNSYRFFEHIEIPKVIPKPMALIPPGRSALTPQGPTGDKIAEPIKLEAPRPAATDAPPAGAPF